MSAPPAASASTHTPAGVDAGAEADAAWVQSTRADLALVEKRLAKRFEQGDSTDRIVALRTRAVDHALKAAWARCVPKAAGLALFAVGGYGRGELFPQSDVDILVVGEPDAQQANHDALARFFALLWSAGLAISHAVRSAAECTQAAADQTVLTALIEYRVLVADKATEALLADAISMDKVWPAREFFAAKRDELRARHARFGDTSDNLEPNIKDGPGGLRDLHTLGWMALRTFGVRDLEQLVGLGHLGADEAKALIRERNALGRLRQGLHLVAGRPEERLRFDYQKALAGRLGFVDDAQSLAVEKMMQGFYRSAAIVRRISDRLLQRLEEQFDGEAVPEPLDAHFILRAGYLAARDPQWLGADLDKVFALFSAWAAHPRIRGLHSRTARALAEALPKLPNFESATVEQRAAFIGLMRGPRAVDTLTRMARLGVLGQYVPAFASVSGRMQFDLFHVYTVDQHTLMVLRNIATFSAGRADERFSIAHEIWPRLRKPELLLLAGLFHDIAKGRGGDHSELGAVDAREFCAAHALGDAESELIAWLVENHLRMSVTAQKQDISDGEVIHRFATLVGDRERLDYLYLLTCADIAGTSPKLWNAWKDRLLADLYFATRRVLRDGLEQPMDLATRLAESRASVRRLLGLQSIPAHVADGLFAAMPRESFLRYRPEQLAWQATAIRGVAAGETRVRARLIAEESAAMEVFVHSPDRDGLFAAILATLDRMGFAIHQARVLMGPGNTVFDTFEVLPTDAYASRDAEEIAAGLQQVLSQPLENVRTSRRAVPRLLKHFRFAPRIEFGVSRDGMRTTLTLVAPDRPGLLSDVAQVLRAQGLRVHDARIATFGERAEDNFQITDEADKLLTEPLQEALREALHASFKSD